MTRAEQIMREIKIAFIESDMKGFFITAERILERLDEIETEVAKVREEIS